MNGLLNGLQKAEFGKISSLSADGYFNKTITWADLDNPISDYGEDLKPNYTLKPLLCQLNFNYRRAWPITAMTPTGSLDRESVQVLFFKPYLQKLGYLDSLGNFLWDRGNDRFIIDGIWYFPGGDTDVSQDVQDGGSAIYYSIILRPSPLATSPNAR